MIGMNIIKGVIWMEIRNNQKRSTLLALCMIMLKIDILPFTLFQNLIAQLNKSLMRINYRKG